MLTGQRIKELCRLRVSAYDGEAGVLDLGKTKNGRMHGIPLCRQARKLMQALRPNTAGIYFPHRFERQRSILTTGPNKTVHTFIEETKVEPFVPRDLRRTWKTLAGRPASTRFGAMSIRTTPCRGRTCRRSITTGTATFRTCSSTSCRSGRPSSIAC